MALKHVRGGNPGSTEVKGNASLISEMPGFHPGTRMVVPCHHLSAQGMKIIPQTSKQNQTTPPCLADSSFHVPSRHLQAVLSQGTGCPVLEM